MESGLSGSEIDFGMFVPQEKQRNYKKNSDNESVGIYSKLRNTIRKANPKGKKGRRFEVARKNYGQNETWNERRRYSQTVS